MKDVNNKKIKLLDIWYNDLYLASNSHYDAASRYARRNMQLGIPITILSAIAGTTIFSTITTGNWLHIFSGIISFIVACLAALHTFLRSSEYSERHKNLATKYGQLLTEIELHIHTDTFEEPNFTSWSQNFKSRWDSLSVDSIVCPTDIFKKHLKKHKYSKLKDSL